MKRIAQMTLALFFALSSCGAYAADVTVFGPKQYVRTSGPPDVSSDTFTTPPGQAKIVVKNGHAASSHKLSDRVSSATIRLNGQTLFGPSDFNPHVYLLEAQADLASVNTISVDLKSKPGSFLTIEIIEQIDPPAVSIEASPASIQVGTSATLLWNSTHADSCVIEPEIGTVDVNGSIAVSPAATTTYTITATGMGGTASANATVTVNYPPPILSFTGAPDEIQQGESATLTWSTTYAGSCTIEPEIGTVEANGSITVSPSETTTYIITASGPGGISQAVATIAVSGLQGPPSVEFTATPSVVPKGQSAVLSWNSRHAQSAHIDNGIGSVPVAGSVTVSPSHTTTFTITATGPTGSAGASVQVMVTGNPEPPAEGSFAETYQNLIPADATIESYDSRRFSVITGLVYGDDGSLMADVSVTIHGHPEYGTAFTAADGRFSIPMDGGATFTIAYNKDGWLTSHRKVYVPWNDIAIAEKVVMVSQDPLSTIVTFDGNPATVVTHRSSEVTDELGSRSATLVIRGDNAVYATDENGNELFPLSAVTIRATEYSSLESMPAVLPPTSAYTYCVELQVDGVPRVRFEKTVIVWVDNFLGFDVGSKVPAGYYDRDKGLWVPVQNGVVVMLLDTDEDGIVDALDAGGDGQPDDLNLNGNFSDEIEGLTDSLRYPPGSSFWRIGLSHFSPWDLNWPYGPPADAITPNPEGIPVIDQQIQEQKDCKIHVGSFVEERSRIFHEDIPVPGTDLSLHYASNRVEGYRSVVEIPASGDTVPANLKRILVKMHVAGRIFERELDALPDQTVAFAWDGTDYMGQKIEGATQAFVQLGFVYDGVYMTPSNLLWAFARVGNELTRIRARQEVILWKQDQLSIRRPFDGTDVIAKGWTLSAHHQINHVEWSYLNIGDGSSLQNTQNIIQTVSGDGIGGYGGDGGPAIQARLKSPNGIAVDSEGNLYIADYYNKRIRKVDTSGMITTVAGTGIWGFSGDGGPAVLAQLRYPTDVAVDSRGNLYIADNYRIRKVNTDGMISTVAGKGTRGSAGDGGPAILAMINPIRLAVDIEGNIYFSEDENHRVRRIDSRGIITTVAGCGIEGFGGDGGPAVDAKLNWPYGVVLDASGNLYIADCDNQRIRKVDQSGRITTVAGSGPWGWNGGAFSGDGGPAVLARLNKPFGLAIDPVGNLYFSELYNRRIRRLDTSGVISTVAGIGTYGFSGDGGPATLAQLRRPFDVALDAKATLYFSDVDSHTVRKVDLPHFSGLLSDSALIFPEKDGSGFIMSDSGLHRKTIDLETGVLLRGFDYDQQKKLIAIYDAFGNRIALERDTQGIATAIISPDGLRTELQIDSDNFLRSIMPPDGNQFNFEYLSNGLMTAKIEPEENRFEHVFDANGKLIDVFDEEGGHWHFARSLTGDSDVLVESSSAEGNLTTYLDHNGSDGSYSSVITDPSNAQTLFIQSADGLSVNKTLPCGMDYQFQYDVDPLYKFKYVRKTAEKTPSGKEKITTREKAYQDTDLDGTTDRVTETIAVNGKSSILRNDLTQSQKTVTSPVGRTVTSHYDPETLLIGLINVPGFYDTSYQYRDDGKLDSIETGTRQTLFSYNTAGFLDSMTDAEGSTVSYGYDPVGRINLIVRPDGSQISFSYDKNGNMTMLRNPVEISHGFSYNRVNLNSQYQTPLSGSYRHIYDRDRRLIETIFPSEKRIQNIYETNRLAEIITPERTIHFSYFCGDRVESIQSAGETISYGYDGKLFTSEAISGTLNQSLSYTYDNDFHLESFTYAGQTTSYTYDNDGLLTGSGPFTVSRNAGNGLPATVSDGVFSLNRTFSGYGEIETQSHVAGGLNVFSWTLGRDRTGRITSKSETVGGAVENYAYAYDAAGRLETVIKDGVQVEQYAYDINGTRIFEWNALKGIAGRSFTYSDEDHLLTAGDTTYQYDLDGFLTTKTKGAEVTTYDYSSRGELLSVSLPDGRIIEYIHDPLGRRIAKKVNGVTVEKYLWSGLTSLLAVYDGTGALKMRFEYADTRMPVSVTMAGVTYYLAYDQIGSLRLVVEGAGNVIKEMEYDSFGNVIFDNNSAFEIPFDFAGGLHDRDSGLVRFGYRDYDPEICRWTAKDPILFAGGDTDLYGYADNDPMNSTDPMGLERYRLSGQKIVFGRESAWIQPGDPISTYLVDHFAHMHQTSEYHDRIVDKLINGLGVPDFFANYPTMIPSYGAACMINNLWKDREDPANYFIIFEWKW